MLRIGFVGWRDLFGVFFTKEVFLHSGCWRVRLFGGGLDCVHFLWVESVNEEELDGCMHSPKEAEVFVSGGVAWLILLTGDYIPGRTRKQSCVQVKVTFSVSARG